MAKTFNDVINIMRRVVGENDLNNPDATQSLISQYVADFYSLIMGQELRSFDLYSFFEFTTIVDQDEYDFKDKGFTTIHEPIYIIDSNNAETMVTLFLDPGSFYNIHPVDKSNEEHSRPFNMLFYNNKITLRPKPDATYTVKIKAYKELSMPTDGSGNLNPATSIEQDYFLRYIAYGAALDYFSDFGQIDEYNKIFPIFERYKRLVMNRTAKQFINFRSTPAL